MHLRRLLGRVRAIASTRRGSTALSGLGSVGSGVLGAGVLTYLFLSLAGRVLGPVGFAPLSTLWALTFIVGPGLFLPVQQELGRVIGGQRGERGGARAARKVLLIAVGMVVVVGVAALAAGSWLTRELFDGHWALLWCFEGALAAYAVSFTARGVLSGLGDFKDFGRLVVAESAARLVIGGILALLGGRSAATFGVAIAAAPLVSTLIVTRLGARTRLAPGQPTTWRDATRAMGWLVLGAMLAQSLANTGPLAVQLLATPSEEGQAGRFLSALVLARLSLYLFQAVQATLLPNLAGLVAAGRTSELTLALRRLTSVCLVLVVVSTIGAYVLGPLAVRLLFGADFTLTRTTMALLAGASSVLVLATALSGAAIAAAGHRLNAAAWALGMIGFVVGTLLADGLFLRVELGYLLGSCTVAVALLLWLPPHIRRVAPTAD
jgi:O-antigen/teichoic acid export membrane protein